MKCPRCVWDTCECELCMEYLAPCEECADETPVCGFCRVERECCGSDTDDTLTAAYDANACTVRVGPLDNETYCGYPLENGICEVHE